MRRALFEADVARTVKNRAPHVSLLCLGIRIANLFAVLLVADIFKPVDILSIQSFLNGDMSHLRRRRAVPVLQVPGETTPRRRDALPRWGPALALDPAETGR